MGIRDVATGFARASSGIWEGVADAIEPSSRKSTPHREPDHAPQTPLPADDNEKRLDGPANSEGQMLVPLDTWTRILEQIGNVHEAGQQLADARERAARAEAENEFLRTQLSDLKAQKRSTRKPASPAAATPPTLTEPVSESGAAQTLRRARERAGKWLSP